MELGIEWEISSVEEGNITEKKRKRKEGRRENREKKEKEKKRKEEEEKGRRTGCSPSIFRCSADQGLVIVHAPRGRGFLLLGYSFLRAIQWH